MATKNDVVAKGHLERVSHVESEPRRRLPPIEGFETMPLVPIEQSVERLVRKITNVKKYASKAKEIAKQNYSPSDALSVDEAAAIRLYTMQWSEEDGHSVYSAMNYELENKDREALKPWFPYLRLILTGLLKLPPISCHVFRGVNKALHENYRNTEKKALWWRFSSCTKTIEVLENKNFLGQSGERTLFDIICSEGRDIKAYSDYQGEEEVLLLPGTLFKIKEVAKMANGLHMITLEETDTDIYLPARRLLSSPRIPIRIIPTLPRCPFRGVAEFGQLGLTDAEVPEIVDRVIVDKQCTRLILSDNNIRADGLVKLAKAAKDSQMLVELNLARNHLTDDDVRALAEELTIDDTVDDKPSGCPCPWSTRKTPVAVGGALQVLNLAENDIGDRGVKHLATLLSHPNARLKKLHLDGNTQITAKSVGDFTRMLKGNTSLETLRLTSCGFTSEAQKQIKKAFASRKGFHLHIDSD